MMNLFTPEEIERINKSTEKNSRMEIFFDEKREGWNTSVEPLFSTLNIDLSNPNNSYKIFEAQATALTFRQKINEEITSFLIRRGKEDSKLRSLKHEKLVFYAVSSPLKATSQSDKSVLIEGHIAENQRGIQIIESYIDFLRETNKTLESFQYSIKNRIELMNYLGK
jgi:hypothetical protein